MIHLAPANEESQNWIRTIDEGKGYAAIDAASFRRLLGGIHRYAFYRVLKRYLLRGSSVLEAGCGWGLSSFALAERNVLVTAVDISEKLIESLQRLQAELGGRYAANLSLVAWDIFRLAEMNKTFCAVFSDGTYEHFDNPEDRQRILWNVRAALKQHGFFMVAVPNLRNPFFNLVVDRKMPPMHAFTIDDLATELEQGGFEVLEKGFSFVNPGFEQWVQSRWMIGLVHSANSVFRFLPRPIKRLFAAHLYCVGRKR